MGICFRIKSTEEKNLLLQIESQIIELLLENLTSSFSIEDKLKILDLERKKDELLRKEEEPRTKKLGSINRSQRQ